MRNTTNLELPIIEDDDSMSLIYTQGNVTNEKLDTLFEGYAKIPQTLETLQGSVNRLTTDLSVTNNNIDNINQSLVVMNDKISNVEINVDGVTKKGELKRTIIKSTPTYKSYSECVPLINTTDGTITDVAQRRCQITSYSGVGNVNLTQLLGLSNVKDILILGSTIYSDEYVDASSAKSNTIPMTVYSVQKLNYSSATDDIYLTYGGEKTMFVNQTYQSSIGSFIPNPTPATPSSDVYVVLNYVKFK